MRTLRTLPMLLVLAAVSAPGIAHARPKLEDPVPANAVRRIVPIADHRAPITGRSVPITGRSAPIKTAVVPIQSKVVDKSQEPGAQPQ